MSGTKKPKKSVFAHLIKLYEILLRFALKPIVSEIMKNSFYPLAS